MTKRKLKMKDLSALKRTCFRQRQRSKEANLQSVQEFMSKMIKPGCPGDIDKCQKECPNTLGKIPSNTDDVDHGTDKRDETMVTAENSHLKCSSRPSSSFNAAAEDNGNVSEPNTGGNPVLESAIEDPSGSIVHKEHSGLCDRAKVFSEQTIQEHSLKIEGSLESATAQSQIRVETSEPTFSTLVNNPGTEINMQSVVQNMITTKIKVMSDQNKSEDLASSQARNPLDINTELNSPEENNAPEDPHSQKFDAVALLVSTEADLPTEDSKTSDVSIKNEVCFKPSSSSLFFCKSGELNEKRSKKHQLYTDASTSLKAPKDAVDFQNLTCGDRCIILTHGNSVALLPDEKDEDKSDFSVDADTSTDVYTKNCTMSSTPPVGEGELQSITELEMSDAHWSFDAYPGVSGPSSPVSVQSLTDSQLISIPLSVEEVAFPEDPCDLEEASELVCRLIRDLGSLSQILVAIRMKSRQLDSKPSTLLSDETCDRSRSEL